MEDDQQKGLQAGSPEELPTAEQLEERRRARHEEVLRYALFPKWATPANHHRIPHTRRAIIRGAGAPPRLAKARWNECFRVVSQGRDI